MLIPELKTTRSGGQHSVRGMDDNQMEGQQEPEELIQVRPRERHVTARCFDVDFSFFWPQRCCFVLPAQFFAEKLRYL
ncbi:hypothetical protein [Paraburkholderia sp. 32]|uniref:hypothetical protein n=1 Tax=Paraburkholderia sp. 32 TaxID=2991057 RepID=UPI003D1A467E